MRALTLLIKISLFYEHHNKNCLHHLESEVERSTSVYSPEYTHIPLLFFLGQIIAAGHQALFLVQAASSENKLFTTLLYY